MKTNDGKMNFKAHSDEPMEFGRLLLLFIYFCIVILTTDE
jgi:hypothetical protein